MAHMVMAHTVMAYTVMALASKKAGAIQLPYRGIAAYPLLPHFGSRSPHQLTSCLRRDSRTSPTDAYAVEGAGFQNAMQPQIPIVEYSIGHNARHDAHGLERERQGVSENAHLRHLSVAHPGIAA